VKHGDRISVLATAIDPPASRRLNRRPARAAAALSFPEIPMKGFRTFLFNMAMTLAAGTIPLEDAQHEITTDWVATYIQQYGTP
jgi:hypothetical protein